MQKCIFEILIYQYEFIGNKITSEIMLEIFIIIRTLF